MHRLQYKAVDICEFFKNCHSCAQDCLVEEPKSIMQLFSARVQLEFVTVHKLSSVLLTENDTKQM